MQDKREYETKNGKNQGCSRERFWQTDKVPDEQKQRIVAQTSAECAHKTAKNEAWSQLMHKKKHKEYSHQNPPKAHTTNSPKQPISTSKISSIARNTRTELVHNKAHSNSRPKYRLVKNLQPKSIPPPIAGLNSAQASVNRSRCSCRLVESHLHHVLV